MADIRHRVGISAPAATVRDALTTIDGLSQWWTRDVDGDPNEGGALRFYFGSPEPSAIMDVVEVSSERVAWRCSEGPDEWVDTNLTFELMTSEDETVILFTHSDWKQPVAFMHHCSTKWGYFLLELKAWLEGGKAHAFPNDLAISSWG